MPYANQLPEGGCFCPNCLQVMTTAMQATFRYSDTPCLGDKYVCGNLTRCREPIENYVSDPAKWPFRFKPA